MGQDGFLLFMMIEKATERELTIEKLALDGQAIAHHDGFTYFVRNGVPGDVVLSLVTRVKRNYGEAEIRQMISPSIHRVQPKCRFFGTCGGCTWQHVSYETQLQEKQQHVVDAFQRIGRFEDFAVSPIVKSDEIYFYRNKMEFSFSRQRWLTQEELARKDEFAGEFGLGFHVARRFAKVLDIDECWLQSELSNGILNAVRAFCRERLLSIYSTKTHEGYLRHLVIRQSKRTGEVMVNLVTTTEQPDVMRELCSVLLDRFPGITTITNNITTRKSMIAVGEREKVYHGPGYITERLGKYIFRISANSFFQTNTVQAEKLYEIAKRMGEFSPTDVVYDLYCGTGTIALYLSDAVGEVLGIDVVESAIEDARLNAQLNKVQNCRFLLGDLKDKLTKDRSWLTKKPDAVILDPPRSGLHPRVVEEIAALSPERLVYISCNPATQARDAKMLYESGYDLLKLQPIDMFPHTTHVENVAAFRRRIQL